MENILEKQIQRERKKVKILENIIETKTRELYLALKKAENADKMKTLFLVNMSHELRTPLHSILSFSKLGINSIQDKKLDKLPRYLNQIYENGQRLKELLDDLLDLSKLEIGEISLELVPNNLSSTIKNILENMDPLFKEKKQKVTFQISNVGEKALFDPKRVQQVLSNILTNSQKYSPEGSKIIINLKKNEINKNNNARTLAYTVEIIDNGPGVPIEDLEHIFDAFYQGSHTRKKSGGTGLGLSICKKIVELHGGTIHASNHHPHGFRVVFSIPAEHQHHGEDYE